MNATFPKSERLCSKILIDELFASATARRSGGFTVKYVRIHSDETPTEMPKVLISVPKRFQRHAVDRNRTKRLIREVYRKHKAEYLSTSKIHSMAIIYASSKVPDYAFVETHLVKIMDAIR